MPWAIAAAAMKIEAWKAAGKTAKFAKVEPFEWEPTLAIRSLFHDLELPYDSTGVEILREYLMSLGDEE